MLCKNFKLLSNFKHIDFNYILEIYQQIWTFFNPTRHIQTSSCNNLCVSSLSDTHHFVLIFLWNYLFLRCYYMVSVSKFLCLYSNFKLSCDVVHYFLKFINLLLSIAWVIKESLTSNISLLCSLFHNNTSHLVCSCLEVNVSCNLILNILHFWLWMNVAIKTSLWIRNDRIVISTFLAPGHLNYNLNYYKKLDIKFD